MTKTTLRPAKTTFNLTIQTPEYSLYNHHHHLLSNEWKELKVH